MPRAVRYPWPATLAAVVRAGRVLLIRRAHMPDAGHWAFPGGKIRPGETLFTATARELAEETGIDATPYRVFDAVDVIDTENHLHYVLVGVLCRWQQNEPLPADDALDAAWVTSQEMSDLPLAKTFDVRAVAETALKLVQHELVDQGPS